jgi:hypothetical protein
MRNAGRYDSHSDCGREDAHTRERGSRRVERGVDNKRRVSDAGNDLEAMVM